MYLREVNFGSVWGASGVQGFFGEGYRFHNVLKPFGLRFSGITFVAKTTTIGYKVGNMPLKADGITSQEWFPKCVKPKLGMGAALNSVGLSGPGAQFLFDDGRWQKRTEPFCLSFMSIGATATARHEELKQFVDLARKHLPNFQAPFALQINFSCPNVGLHPDELAHEVLSALKTASTLIISLIPKFNVLLPPELALEISRHPHCDALCVSNTIPWGALPNKIDWKRMFGSDISPLHHLGGGGLSGAPLLPLVVEWIARARKLGMKTPINGGGGILSFNDAQLVMDAGANSVFLGSMAMLRGWRMQKTINQVRAYAAKGKQR